MTEKENEKQYTNKSISDSILGLTSYENYGLSAIQQFNKDKFGNCYLFSGMDNKVADTVTNVQDLVDNIYQTSNANIWTDIVNPSTALINGISQIDSLNKNLGICDLADNQPSRWLQCYENSDDNSNLFLTKPYDSIHNVYLNDFDAQKPYDGLHNGYTKGLLSYDKDGTLLYASPLTSASDFVLPTIKREPTLREQNEELKKEIQKIKEENTYEHKLQNEKIDHLTKIVKEQQVIHKVEENHINNETSDDIPTDFSVPENTLNALPNQLKEITINGVPTLVSYDKAFLIYKLRLLLRPTVKYSHYDTIAAVLCSFTDLENCMQMTANAFVKEVLPYIIIIPTPIKPDTIRRRVDDNLTKLIESNNLDDVDKSYIEKIERIKREAIRRYKK